MSSREVNIYQFIAMLKNLQFKFLVKYADESVDVPSSIMIKKKISRNDVLAHRRVKLFISHGDIMGIQEAAFHGVPMIIIPMYGDQV
jgi:glucuronosyltransferase